MEAVGNIMQHVHMCYVLVIACPINATVKHIVKKPLPGRRWAYIDSSNVYKSEYRPQIAYSVAANFFEKYQFLVT